MRLFSLILLLILLFPVSLHAQGHATYCDMADSTAAIQACLKKHLDAAQKRLNSVYDDLNSKVDTEEKKQELRALQQKWLEYRDAECGWEAEQTETASLKRINELSCMARVTDDRADLLTVIAMDDEAEGVAREYGSFPRWMNVLAKDYPSVYWDYGKRFAEDLNCDGENEQMMTGLSVKKVDDALQQEIVIAVTQNPATGRPKPALFKFDVGDEIGEKTLCSTQVGLQKTEIESEQEDNDEEQEVCGSVLLIKHGSCDQRKIQWNGKAFGLEPLPVSEEEKEEEKND